MKKRFVGPANPGPDPATGQWVDDLGHEVNVAGQYVGRVKSGEVLDIPDALTAGTKENPAPVWPSELWEDAADKPATKTATKKGDD